MAKEEIIKVVEKTKQLNGWTKKWGDDDSAAAEILLRRISVHLQKREFEIAHRLVDQMAREKIEETEGVVGIGQLGLTSKTLVNLEKFEIFYIYDLYHTNWDEFFSFPGIGPLTAYDLHDASVIYGLGIDFMQYVPENLQPVMGV